MRDGTVGGAWKNGNVFLQGDSLSIQQGNWQLLITEQISGALRAGAHDAARSDVGVQPRKRQQGRILTLFSARDLERRLFLHSAEQIREESEAEIAEDAQERLSFNYASFRANPPNNVRALL